jgi:transcriptional regulator with XRE-family HTH domain
VELLIKEAAKRRNMSMKVLAEKTGIDASSLSRYNTGRIEAPLEKLKLIAEVLDCEIAELLPTGSKFAHFIDRNEWLGIRKK